MRKVLFWIHLAAGCVAGVVILIMSVTGVLLAYEHEIVSWADGNHRSAPPSGAQPLPPSALLAAVDSSPDALTLRADPSLPAELSFGRERVVFVDRYRGTVIGEGSIKARKFFASVTAWHRWLGAAGSGREPARSITGACNLAFFVLILTGPILWLPKQWSRARVRQAIWFRRGLVGKARDWNWHNTIGIWTALPLAVIVGCAVFMSYPWANNLLFRLAGGAGMMRPRQEAHHGKRTANLADLNKLWPRAEQQVPGWQSITLRIPSRPRGPVTFSIDSGDGGRPDLRSQLTLDRETLTVRRWEPFSSYGRGRRIRSWMRFLHTGEAGGIAGKTVAAVASAGGVFLVWTGISLAIRRLLRARRKAAQSAAASTVAAGSV